MRRLRRALVVVLILGLMAAFGVGVNRYIASRQTSVGTAPIVTPVQEKPKFTLPGTIFVAQGGALYALHGTQFTQIRPAEGWMQPALLPDGTGLLAVKQTVHYYSDIYVLGSDGTIRQQLTHNGKPTKHDSDLAVDHWAFYPQQGSDGRVYFSYDQPKAGYKVDLAVWSSPPDAFDTKQMKRFTTPNSYTGGDVQPIPVTAGGILYTGYQYGTDGKVFSQIFYQGVALTNGVALTKPEENCAQPSLSAQGMLAFVCSPSSTAADISVARFDSKSATLLNRRTVVTGTMAASPTWSPDGTTLLFEAPATSGSGYFELWWLDHASSAPTAPPREITANVDLDATSAAAWSAT